jgi:hypothetical protein
MAEENQEKRSARDTEEQGAQESGKERTSYADALDESLEQGYFGRGTEDKDRDAYTLRTGPSSPPYFDEDAGRRV